MAGDTVITVIGNLTADPELRFTANGATPVANFTVASTPRTYDRGTGEWKDGEALFLRCSVWREAAENVAETLTKGMRVIVQGRLTQRSYETREGERRTVVELQVDEVGPSLRYASAKVQRNPRSGGYDAGGSQGGTGGGYGGSGSGGYSNAGGYSAPAGGGFGTAPAGGGYGAPPAPPRGGEYGGGSTEDRWAAPGVARSADDEPPF
ncbi:MAG: single-stranded DNA-binding protein [Bifidobacteriaceae bacterium]|jgi:single-strand DNA-binding protein|nr:single-stranded DNA-binding protein [Bifidobacteriaceae bacterium]